MGIKAVLLDIDGVLIIRDRKNLKIALVTNTTRVPSLSLWNKP